MSSFAYIQARRGWPGERASAPGHDDNKYLEVKP